MEKKIKDEQKFGGSFLITKVKLLQNKVLYSKSL